MECDKASNLGFSPGRILDRKIESKGLAQSFSANISRKGTPKKSDSGRRVKDLVDRLEKARGSTPSDVDRKESNRPNNASRPDEVDSKLGESSNDVADEVGEVTIGVVEYSADSSGAPHPFVEECSLTLLEFKPYFNNQPLGRCLDNLEQQHQTKKDTIPQDYSAVTPSMEKPTESSEGTETGKSFVRDPAEAEAF